MDDIDDIHTILVNMDMPSTIADLKNPTKDYIVTLITQFLSKLQIDVSTIRKPTFEQQNLSLVEENADILGLVNLSEALASICSKLFLNNFLLTDITSPIPRRSRKIAKLMANFLLYASQKMIEMEARFDMYEAKHQQLCEIRKERMAILDAKNEQALRIAQNMKTNEQIKAKISILRRLKDDRRSRRDENEEELKVAQQEKIEAEQRHRDLTAQAIKTRKKLEDVRSRVVRSPERYETQLRDLLEQKKEQSEKRENVQELLQKKLPAIQQTQSCHTFVRQLHSEFPEVTDLYNSFAESKKVIEHTMKQLADMKNTIHHESNMATEDGSQVNDIVLQEAKTQCENNLSAVRKEHKKLSTEKKVLKQKNEELKTRLQEILLKKNEIRARIVEKESKCKKYLEECQTLYNTEIQKEREIYSKLKPLLEKKDKDCWTQV